MLAAIWLTCSSECVRGFLANGINASIGRYSTRKPAREPFSDLFGGILELSGWVLKPSGMALICPTAGPCRVVFTSKNHLGVYFVCQKKFGNPVAVFSQSAEWHMAQISRWLGIEANDPGEINEKRSLQKIADVLYWFKDER